jgi:hypothetical protein
MVCLYCELYLKEGSLMMSASAVSTGIKRESRLVRELASLFGEATLKRSREMDIGEMLMQAENIDESVSRLQAQAGKPVEAQRKVIQSLSGVTAAALCKWLMGSKAW